MIKYFILFLMLISYVHKSAFADYTRHRMSIIENGSFENTEPAEIGLGAFWLKTSRRGITEIPKNNITRAISFDGRFSLHLERGDSIYQYLPGVQEYSDSLIFSASIYLPDSSSIAKVIFTSADNKSVICFFGPRSRSLVNDSTHIYFNYKIGINNWHIFELPIGKEFKNYFNENPSARFTLTLECAAGSCYFDAIDVQTDFYYLPPEELKKKILDEMKWTFDLWIQHGLDKEGPEQTPCVSHIHDALTGEELSTISQCPVWASYPVMINYLYYRDNAEYLQLVKDQADLFLRTRFRETNFMRYWDPVNDKATGNAALLPVSYFWQVYDLTKENRFRDAALALTDTALVYAKKGWLDHAIHEGYFTYSFNADGTVRKLHENSYQVFIRWFDLVRRLSEAHKRYPNQKYLETMVECAELYITPGTIQYEQLNFNTINFEPRWYDWKDLVPAFDDYFGYGIQGLWKVWEATGFNHQGIEAYLEKAFADMGQQWWSAMFLGGREAGDEFRGWTPYFWAWQFDPVKFENHQKYLIQNGRTLLKSTFWTTGSWVAVSYKSYQPLFGLPGEGATTGASGNSLSGFYMAWEASNQNPDFYAAMVSLFRTSQLTYKFDYGYIRTPEPNTDGSNIAGGEFRYINRWFSILEALGFTTGKIQKGRNTIYAKQNFQLAQNYPNPFNANTTIEFFIPKSALVRISIFDVQGKLVKKLACQYFCAGNHKINFAANKLTSGIYFFKMYLDELQPTNKMLLIR